RTVLRLTAAAAAAPTLAQLVVTTPVVHADQQQNGDDHDDDNDRDIVEASIAGLQARMTAGKTTSRDLTSDYIERIRRLDPKLHSVIETNPDAVSIAAALDAERRNGKVRGPLHGIPILLKDNIDTADKEHTTAGSFALARTTPSQDATVARLLREAGAV